MFYSQFILAKKGPLGTIWIAAHLERKLRKNQVADTDIGVSVDSILFPDVPIALRLSSHLLLGVVRIYSRKVNYLFDDCSEALLKIKQAFRSAAVDLPPEESTAPYHSITLPETFDLDDFELPDNEILQGNYADHHVSAREQITLQDTMDGVVYSTSQFGLDERFGDGDGGQIDLDLDQGNLLEKVAAPLHDRVQDDDPEESAQPLTPFEVDVAEDILSSASKAVLKSCTSKNQVEDLNKSSPFHEYAEAPSTPGLVQEASLCSVQEGMLSSDHLEADAQNLSEPVEIECRGDSSDKYDNYHGNRSSVDDHMHDKIDEKSNSSIPSKENGYLFVNMEIEEAKTDGYSKYNLEQSEASNLKSPVSMSVNALENFSNSPEGIKNDIAATKMPSVSITNQIDEKCEEFAAPKFAEAVEPSPCSPGPESDKCKAVEFFLDKEMASSREEVIPFNSNLNEEHFNSNLNEEHSVSFGDKDGSSVVERVSADADVPVVDKNQILRPFLAGNQTDCSAICEQLSNIPPNELLDGANRSVDMELSVPENFVECVEADVNRPALDRNQILQPVFADNLAVGSNVFEQLNNIPPNDLLDSANRSMDVELSAPEKLLSVPDEISVKHLLVESTPNKEALQNDQTADLSYMLGRKRTFSESTLTEQDNSLKSAEDSYFKRTETTIPDDEDLLSSILVGRRSLTLKMKPTPVPPASSKRAKTTDRSNASKRKVLVDDSLILHGDTIRLQLTSTEDLRRLRKKAPCTLPEIAVIQRHFLEDEIFSEPIFTGVSREFLKTYKGAYDVSGIKICEHIKAVAPAEASKDIESPIKPNITGETEVEVTVSPAKPSVSGEADAELFIGPPNVGEVLQEQAMEPVVQSNVQQLELLESQDINFETEGSKLEPLEKIPEMHTENANVVAADYSLVSEPGSQILVDSVCEDMSRLPQNSPAELNSIDKGSSGTCLQIDVPSVLENQSLNINDYENVTPSVDPTVENGVNCTEVVQSDVQPVIAEPESKTGDEGFMNERLPVSSVNLREDLPADQYPNRHEDETSLTPQFGVYDQCHNMSLNGDDTFSEFRRSSIETVTEDKSQDARCNIMDPADFHHGSDVFHLQEHKEDPSSASLNYENSSFQDDHAGRNEEIPIPNQSPINNYDDFESMAVADDTEFLNVDDDDMDQDDEYMGDPEEAQLLENIGWSSRTRAVAKYLQTLFNKEDALGREVLSMDNLLARKTRKEASRLFFESLVLNTRDYIQVEQEKPFDNINIRPRMKLMKSTF